MANLSDSMTREHRSETGFAITLVYETALEDWAPLTIAIPKKQLTHRIIFKEYVPIIRVFRGELVSAVRPFLKRLGASPSVYSAPNVKIELPGLTLEKLRVVDFTDDEVGHQTTLRFGVVTGDPQLVLRSMAAATDVAERMTCDAYVESLDRVLIPALNIMTLLELDGIESLDARQLNLVLQQLRDSRGELLFQIELVKRQLQQLQSNQLARELRSSDVLESSLLVSDKMA